MSVVMEAGQVRPRDRRPLARRLAPGLSLAGVAAAATAALAVRDPHSDGSWGKCPSLLFFGVYCPLCGGLRAVNDLTHLDIGAAFSSNALAVALLPLLVLWWAVTMRDRWRGCTRPWFDLAPSRRWNTVLLLAVLVFTVVRNLPFGAALAP